jgi:hypothetical protein
MSEPGMSAPGLQILQTRVYYDPQTGDIVHVHRLAVATGDMLEQDRIEEEMAVFEASLEQRHGRPLDHIVVDDAELTAAIAPDVHLRVDLDTRHLVTDQTNG